MITTVGIYLLKGFSIGLIATIIFRKATMPWAAVLGAASGGILADIAAWQANASITLGVFIIPVYGISLTSGCVLFFFIRRFVNLRRYDSPQDADQAGIRVSNTWMVGSRQKLNLTGKGIKVDRLRMFGTGTVVEINTDDGTDRPTKTAMRTGDVVRRHCCEKCGHKHIEEVDLCATCGSNNIQVVDIPVELL